MSERKQPDRRRETQKRESEDCEDRRYAGSRCEEEGEER